MKKYIKHSKGKESSIKPLAFEKLETKFWVTL